MLSLALAAILTFDPSSAIARVRPGASTVWLTSSTQSARSTFFAIDRDGDGEVRWNRTQPTGIFSVIDLASGAFDVQPAGGARAEGREVGAYALGSEFALPLESTFSSEWNIVWARPGVGAWRMSIVDGEDLDGRDNDLVLGSIEAMVPFDDAPAHPARFEDGDVLIAMSPGAGIGNASPVYFASRVGAQQAAGLIEALQRDVAFAEEQGLARLPVIRLGGASGVATVRYRTVDGSAHAGSDYLATDGTLVFEPGRILQWIEVPLIDHPAYRGVRNAQFEVLLSDATGTALGAQNRFVVSVLSGEHVPVITIAGDAMRTIRETDVPQALTFELTLDGASAVPAVVAWTVTTNQFITKRKGSVKFGAGVTSRAVTIALPGDEFLRFTATQLDVVFEAVSGATLAGATHVTIAMEEDDGPFFYPDPFSWDEGDVARQVFTMEPSRDRFVNWETMDGSAIAGRDYVADSGVFHFTANNPWGRADIVLPDNEVLDGDREFYIRLENGVVGTVTIRDDELHLGGRPTIAISDASASEDAGAAVVFEVSLPFASTLPISVAIETGEGTAVAGFDYETVRETIVFAPGETKKPFIVPILDDAFGEEDETFYVFIRAMLNAQVRHLVATGTIQGNDPGNARRRSTRH